MSDLHTDPTLTSSVSDAVRIQILATEHWGLLATRSMTWNEVFARAGMFLTTLSAAIVSLALIAQAAGFGETFRLFALVVLPAVLFLGIGTFIRLGNALAEDAWTVLGMNRLRHAYLEIAPELEPYFITDHHDDVQGLLRSFGPSVGNGPGRILSATPVIVAVIDAMVGGTLVALVLSAVTDEGPVWISSGVATAVAGTFVMVAVLPYRQIARMQRDYQPRFPHPVVPDPSG